MNIERELENWLVGNEINGIRVCTDTVSAFDLNNNIIHISFKHLPETDKLFRQFIYEYGCVQEDIPFPVLSFLHEVGHVMTISRFDAESLYSFRISRMCYQLVDHSKFELAFNYWESPEEFAANIWAINFINNNFQEVQYLINIVNSCNIYTGVI